MKNVNALKFYKIFAIATFGTGLLLHTSRAILGADYFLEHILTINNDKLFSIPMVLASIYSWLAFKDIDFEKMWRKVIYTIIAVYITISIPVHVKSWFTEDMKQLEAFPEEYSYFILPVILAMLLFTLSLKNKQQRIIPNLRNI
jgi:hypothetical protein